MSEFLRAGRRNRGAVRLAGALAMLGLVALAFAGPAIAQSGTAVQMVPLPRPDPRDTAAPEPAAQPEAAPRLDPATMLEELAAPTNEPALEEQLSRRAPTPAPATEAGVAPRGDRRDLHDFVVVARLVAGGEPLSDGVVWRVFGTIPGPDGKLPLIGEAEGGALNLSLDTGEYLVHAAYGRAGATKRIGVSRFQLSDEVILNAGGIRLTAYLGEDKELAPGQVSFEIYQEEAEYGELTLIVPSAKPGQVIRLNAGFYHVVSRYGASNAVVRADISVEAGKLTEAKIFHKAARVTLKLVAAHGGEALADTSWSVHTPSGDSVVESVGAFPSVILTAGDYVAIARHDGNSYERNFSVETDINRDIEVLAAPSSQTR